MTTGQNPSQWTPIDPDALNAKQKEIYNFQKIAAVLADYGFNCIKLQDDWLGADFLAYHKDGNPTLKVQLKSRVTIDRKYLPREEREDFDRKSLRREEREALCIAFPFIEGGRRIWYLVPHDELVRQIGEHTNWLNTPSWKKGAYSSVSLNPQLREALEPYKLQERG